MKHKFLKLLRLAAVMLVCFGAATLLGSEGREARAELSGCFRECDGLQCEFAAYLTQCDEEDVPEGKICTNFPCGWN